MDYDVTGRWYYSVKTPDGNDLHVTLELKVNGGKVTGTVESPAGIVSVDNGTYADGVAKFKITMDGNDYPHELTAAADGKFLGTLDLGGQVLHFTAVQVAEQPESNPLSPQG
jgi:hypothetical protein